MRIVIVTALLFCNLFALSLDDVKTMRDMKVKIAFPNERNAHKIPKNMTPSKLLKINYLNLNNISLYYLPDWLFKLENLSHLKLKNTKIDVQDLTKLSSLTHLDILDLSDNNLFAKSGSLMNIISNLNLNELYLSNTGGSSSNYANIGAIGSLVKLDLSHNEIGDIDDLNLEKLKNLRELKLNNNSIGSTLYPSELPQQSVEYLNLSHNQIRRIKFNGDFPSLVQFKLFQETPRVRFDDEYNNPFLFPRLKQGAFGDNVVLPKSIMKRLGVKSLQWIDPTKSICEANGGKTEKDGGIRVCKADWTSAKKICRASGGRLATIEELKKVVTGCGGEIDKENSEERERNRNNSDYQNCYKELGFSSNGYWSSTTNVGYVSYTWGVGFGYGYVGNGNKYGTLYVRCVRDGQ